MRIKISYYYNKNANPMFPFWATSTLAEPKNELVMSCGESWDDVRAKQIQKLTDLQSKPEAPIAEEVEI